MGNLAQRLAALDPERRRYTLATLAAHLVAANQRDRLEALFSNRDWLDARYDGSGNVFDDYIEDLEMAWDRISMPAALDESLEAFPGVEYAWCFRYALIRCSLNSLSGTLPPEIVIRAVETGLWPAERALSVAARVPEPERRARLLALLMRGGRLNDLQEARVRRAALAAIRTIGNAADQAAAIREWGPLLDQSDAPELLDLANAMSDGSRALALAALVPLTLPDRRQALIGRALKETPKILSHDQPGVYEILAPYLAGDLADDAVASARALTPEYAAVALAKLGRHLTGPARPELFEESRQKLRQAADDKDRAYAMRDLIDDFPEADRPALATWALRMASGLPSIDHDSDIPQMVALGVAAPFLSPEDAETALLMVADFPDLDFLVSTTIRLMAELSRRVTGSRRQEVLRAAQVRATGKKKDKDRTRSDDQHDDAASVECLAALAAALPQNEAEPLLEQAVAVAFRLPEKAGPSNQLRTPRADALLRLAPLLPRALLEPILETKGEIRDALPQCLALARLTPGIEDPAKTIVAESAVTASFAIDDESWLQDAIETLAPVLPETVMDLGLQAAQSITWDLARGHALASLAARVPDRLMDSTLKAVLGVPFAPSRSGALLALISRLPESRLDEALRAAWDLNWEPGETKCVAAIAARLPEKRRLGELQKLVAKYRKEDDHTGEKLAAMAAAADTAMALELLRIAVTLSDLGAGNAMAALVPILPEEYLIPVVDSLPALFSPKDVLRALAANAGSETLDRAWERSMTIEAERARVDAIEVFAPMFEDAQIEQALEVAHKLTGIWRCVALEALAPRLTADQLRRAEQSALEIEESWIGARALTALIPCLTGPDRQRVTQAVTDRAKRERKEIRGRTLALVNLFPLLEGKRRTATLKLAMRSAARTKIWERLAIYGALLPHVNGGEWESAATELLAIRYDDENRITESLSSMAVPTDPDTRRAARRLLLQHLNRLRDSSRESLLRFVGDCSLFSPDLLGSATLEKIANHIVDICQRWTARSGAVATSTK